MKHVKKSVLLWYSPHEMFSLVTGVREYAQFLPWCDSAEVLEESETGMTARLGLSYAGLRHAFTTRNEHEQDRRVSVHLVDGPFSLLDGIWQFLPLSKPGKPGKPDGEPEQACKIEFDLRYAFSSAAVETVFSPVFDRIANTLVECFVQRAEQVYGPR